MPQTAEDALNRFIGQIRVLLTALDPEAPPEGEPTYEKWSYLLGRVHTCLVRMTICFRDCPSFEDSAPMANMLHDTLLQLLALYQIVTFHSSNCLRETLKAGMATLLEALISLADQLVQENRNYEDLIAAAGSKAKKNQMNFPVDRMFGTVDLALQKLRESPLDDFRAVTVRLEGFNSLIKDAMKEMEAALAAESRAEGDPETEEAPALHDDEDEFWDLDEDDCLGLTDGQKEIVPPCITLIKTSGGVLVQIVKALKKQVPVKADALVVTYQSGAEQAKNAEQLDAIVEQGRQIQFAVDDLACGIYPPQDRQKVLLDAQRLEKLLAALVAMCLSGLQLEEITASITKLSKVASSLTANALQQLKKLCPPQ